MKSKEFGILCVRLIALYLIAQSLNSIPQLFRVTGIDFELATTIKLVLGFILTSLILPSILWVLAPRISRSLVPKQDPNGSLVLNLSYRQIFLLVISLYGFTLIFSSLVGLIGSWTTMIQIPSSPDEDRVIGGILFQYSLQFVLGIYCLLGAKHLISCLEKLGLDGDGNG